MMETKRKIARPCLAAGCGCLTRSESWICATCALVDPRLLELRPDELSWVKANPNKRGAWARLQASQDAAPAVLASADATGTARGGSVRAAAIGELQCDDAVTAHPGRYDFSDIASLAGIGAVLVLLWLACECVR